MLEQETSREADVSELERGSNEDDKRKISPIPTADPVESFKSSKPMRRGAETLNDSSTTSSYTSDDSEDDGAATMQGWLKQLKIQKGYHKLTVSCFIRSYYINVLVVAKGNLAVVRYTPADLRPSILRRDVYHRFGDPERKALTYFDFLFRKSTRSPQSPKNIRAEPKICLRNGRSRPVRQLAMADKRKSGSFSNVQQIFSTNDDYENLPYHRLTRTLSVDLSDKNKSNVDRWRRWESSSSSSLDRFSRRSYGSSLFLSDLCVADRTLSSSSSLSFTNF